MAAFFTRERFGRPQYYAGLLLLAFAAQCLWMIVKTPLGESELPEINRGLAQWRNGQLSPGQESPFVGLLASSGIAALSSSDTNFSARILALLTRLPFLFIGMLCGASLWYVTRRLYGNAGGYVALVLYCFSPSIIRSAALVNAAGPSAWGFFGGIFSAIALSHTVYALKESPADQLLGFRRWRWRRIILLGVAFGIAVAAEYPAALVIPLALGFMLYLAPGRRTACIGIVAVACAIAFTVLLSACFFDLRALVSGIDSGWGQNLYVPISLRASFFLLPLASLISAGWVTIPLLAIALATYLLWRRTRYFGNTAPLMVFVLLWLTLLPFPQLAFEQHAVIFAFVFIAGIMADLLESSQRRLVLAGLLGVLFIHIGTTLRVVFSQ